MTVFENMEHKKSLMETKGPLFGVRHVQAILVFLLVVATQSMRSTFNIAVVAMTETDTSSNPDIPTYAWNNTGVMLSSAYWGYPVVQFFCGHLAHLYGFKVFLILSALLMSLSTVLIPFLAALWGSNGVIACRFITGLAAGFLVPLINTVVGKWIPEGERTWIYAFICIGFQMGRIISISTTGYLATSSYGWPSAFYLFGGIGFIWSLIWIFLGSNGPSEHTRICEFEKNYIERSLGQDEDNGEKIKTPWKHIFTSLPYWAIIVACIGESWGGTTMDTEVPTYYTKVANVDIESTGVYSSVPSMVSMLVGLIYGPISDYLIAKKYCSRIMARKTFQGIACFLPAAAVLAVTFLENEKVILALFILNDCAAAGYIVGHIVNSVDISPRFAGVLLGIANGTGQLVAIVAPLFVQMVVDDPTDRTKWRTVFFTASGIYILCASFFIIYASAERQWWDAGAAKKEEMEREGEEELRVTFRH